MSEEQSFNTPNGFNLTDACPSNFEGFFKACKKPILVDALQVHLPEGFVVNTLEGQMRGNPHDYLVRGADNEPYIVKREIFEKTYEKR